MEVIKIWSGMKLVIFYFEFEGEYKVIEDYSSTPYSVTDLLLFPPFTPEILGVYSFADSLFFTIPK